MVDRLADDTGRSDTLILFLMGPSSPPILTPSTAAMFMVGGAARRVFDEEDEVSLVPEAGASEISDGAEVTSGGGVPSRRSADER